MEKKREIKLMLHLDRQDVFHPSLKKPELQIMLIEHVNANANLDLAQADLDWRNVLGHKEKNSQIDAFNNFK